MLEHQYSDFIKEIIDKNKEEIPLITFSEQNVLFIKLQINIQDSFSQLEFKFTPFCSTKLRYPTPLQYCIISDKQNSLKAILNFMCDTKESHQFFAPPKYQKGLKLKMEPVFFPTVSNTSWPLLQLSVALGRKECLIILTDFLKAQDELENYINRPDIFQMTPISIAFATGNEDIILHLLENGADPYYSPKNEKNIIPFIFTCLNFPDQVPKTIECMKKFYKNDKFDAFEKVKKLFFDESGLAFEEKNDNLMDLDNLLKKVPSVREIYACGIEGKEIIHTFNNLGSNENEKKDNEKISYNGQCSVNGCNEKCTKICENCLKSFCDNHYQNSDVHNCGE